jgi:hypothetical protein
MDIVYISNQIKYDILTICGKPAAKAYNLLTDTPLHSIGYDDVVNYAENLKANYKWLPKNTKPAEVSLVGLYLKTLPLDSASS